MPKRRPKGEGSISQRSDGRWQANRDPLNPPWWHLGFWFYYWRAKREMDRGTEEICPEGCCLRWIDRKGRETGGVNPVGVDHFAPTEGT